MSTAKFYPIKAYHITEKMRLKDVREYLSLYPKEFSNYEMSVSLNEPDSYIFFYHFGSVVFFNVSDILINDYLNKLQKFKNFGLASELVSTGLVSSSTTSDNFIIEVSNETQNKAYYDRIIVKELSFDAIKIASVLLAQSTALEYYENLIENLLIKTNVFSRELEQKGKYLEESEDLIKFIGLCLNTRQEIIANLYIVDSPDEIWENNYLERLFTELKAILDIDVRYRALEHKIRIIQESVEVIVDLSKSRRELRLEMIIVFLIAVEVVLYILSIFIKF
jgi:uncharacterized Rmd1/YagE family protein